MTVCVRAEEVLVSKPVAGMYFAVIECVPAFRVEVLMLQVDVQLPVLLATLSVPSNVAPSKNCTLPSGAVVPLAAVTTAVKVTALPYVEGFALDVTLVVVATRLTKLKLFVASERPVPFVSVILKCTEYAWPTVRFELARVYVQFPLPLLVSPVVGS